MPRYMPIPVTPNIECSASHLIELRWKEDALTADFVIPSDDTHALRVQFDRVEIIRLLDEMPLSTELNGTPNQGLVPNNLAYLVEGAMFFESQSEAFRIVHADIRHYRFVTGWTCLDVLSNSEPLFTVVPLASTQL